MRRLGCVLCRICVRYVCLLLCISGSERLSRLTPGCPAAGRSVVRRVASRTFWVGPPSRSQVSGCQAKSACATPRHARRQMVATSVTRVLRVHVLGVEPCRVVSCRVCVSVGQSSRGTMTLIAILCFLFRSLPDGRMEAWMCRGMVEGWKRIHRSADRACLALYIYLHIRM